MPKPWEQDFDRKPWERQSSRVPAVPENPYLEDNKRAGAADRFLSGATTAVKKRALGVLQTGLEATGQSDTDLYKDTQELATRYRQQQEGTGFAGGVGELAGDPLTYLPVVGGAKTVGQLARVGAGLSAVAGATDPTEAGEDRLSNTATKAATGAVITPVVSKALPAAVNAGVRGTKNLAAGITARGKDVLDEATDALHQQGTQTFERMKAEGLVFSLPRTRAILRNVSASIRDEGTLVPKLHPTTISTLRTFEKELANKPNIGLDELYKWRRNFAAGARQSARGIEPREDDARLLAKAVSTIDDMIDNTAPIDVKGGRLRAVDLLKQGKTEWAKYRKFDEVADLVDRSGGDATKLKTSAEKLLRKAGDSEKYTVDEKRLLSELATRGPADRVMTGMSRFAVGSTLPSLIGSSVGAGIGFATGGGAGAAALVGGGTLAKAARETMTKGAAERLLRTIESGGKIPQKEWVKLPMKVAKIVSDANLVARVGATAGEE